MGRRDESWPASVHRTPSGVLVRRLPGVRPRAILEIGKLQQIVKYMQARGVDGLEVNRSLAPDTPVRLDVLKHFAFVRRLVVLHGYVQIEAIQDMHDLEELMLECECRHSIDFGWFPHLRVLRTYWTKGVLSAFDCQALEDLYMTDWRIETIQGIQRLPRLRRLTVSGGSIRTFTLDSELPLEQLCLTHLRSLADVSGLKRLVQLKQLELSHIPKLTLLPRLEHLSCLEVVKLERVRGLRTLERLGDLSKLRDLALVDMGEINTLRFLARARHLAELWVIYKTRVRDGDLSFVRECRNLRLVKIDESRAIRYEPSLDVIQQIVSSRDGATDT